VTSQYVEETTRVGASDMLKGNIVSPGNADGASAEKPLVTSGYTDGPSESKIVTSGYTYDSSFASTDDQLSRHADNTSKYRVEANPNLICEQCRRLYTPLVSCRNQMGRCCILAH